MKVENDMIKCQFSDVTERDMDLLFLEEFVVSPEFLNIFLSRTDLRDASVCAVEQSRTDADLGESDMTVIVKKDGKKYGLLIEDKIDAKAMQNQAARYIKRGEKGVSLGEYISFYDFIVAPQKYLEDDNTESKKYHYQVSYEDCLAYFSKNNDPRSVFKRQQIEQAIHKKEHGYQLVENLAVTRFWNEYIKYQREYYPQLLLKATDEPKGSRSSWFAFHTNDKRVKIYHKTNLECVDLEFAGLGEKTAELKQLVVQVIGKLWDNKLQVLKKGKSAVLSASVPYVDYKGEFEAYRCAVDEALRKAEQLYSIFDDLPEKDLNALFE